MTSTSQSAGATASTTSTRIAVPADLRRVPFEPAMRTRERSANGRAMAAIVVPIRPPATAPVIAGSRAYATPAHTRTRLLATTSRSAK